jgi:hypothetical protein
MKGRKNSKSSSFKPIQPLPYLPYSRHGKMFSTLGKDSQKGNDDRCLGEDIEVTVVTYGMKQKLPRQQSIGSSSNALSDQSPRKKIPLINVNYSIFLFHTIVLVIYVISFRFSLH